jgi:hydroxypyruvate isomerase
MRLSVCVEMIFTELPFVDRIAAVAAAGYSAYEFWGWRQRDLASVGAATRRAGLAVSGLVLDTPARPVDAETHGQLLQAARETFAVAGELGCRTVILQAGNLRNDRSRAEQHTAIIDLLKELAPLAEDAGVIVALEPLNTLVDHPGYFLTSSHEGVEIIRSVGSPAIRLLFDIYHQQVSEGNVSANLEACRHQIGHLHVAGVPGRHEPGFGELHYPFLIDQLRGWPYTGYIGLEYRPTLPSQESLRRTAQLLGGTAR